MPTSREVRQQFIDFFVEKAGHTAVDSSPVVPLDDPTLLFTNAGMNQFKDVFLGTGERPFTRAVDTQKCIRAGGKHNDLDDVGRDTYHHTFFEMLGNWSFGDYFKAEAIDWAWQLLTGVWGLEPDRLHATYFEGSEADGLEPDDEAHELWLRYLPAERVHPGNAKDNFWEMGDTGPCGPCSEVHYDSTPDKTGGPLVNQDDPNVIEIWNLVFIQFNRGSDGTLTPLPARHVDTGMGFERVVRILQGKDSNYDTDVFAPVFKAIQQVTGARAYRPGGDAEALADPVNVAYRVIADHIRTLTFALTDGAHCGNTGRDSVLRSILRRAVRFGRQTLGVEEPFFYKLVPSVVDAMGEQFPEIKAKADDVAKELEEEEIAFRRTLDRGLTLFEDAAERGGKQIAGEDAFRLYETFGFPIDLTQVMAAERGMTVDMAEYERLFAEHQQVSKGDGGGADARASLNDWLLHHDQPATEFTGYDETVTDGAKVLATLWLGDDGYKAAEGLTVGDAAAIVLDRTPFYAEAGGQVGDAGTLRTRGGAVLKVTDCIKLGGVYFHLGELEDGDVSTKHAPFSPGDDVLCEVDAGRRVAIVKHHTMTHVMNHKLRAVLGEHVQQRGSLVDAEKTRFDLSHPRAVTVDEVARIDELVNADIAADLTVNWQVVPQDEALKIHGLRAVFGEKYPPQVRVVSIGPSVDELLANPDNTEWYDRSVEFCGGVHLGSTAEAEQFTIISEEAVAKGVRRVTAVAGEPAARAIAHGAKFTERVAALADESGEALAAGLTDVTKALGECVIPLTVKADLQAKLAELQKRVKAEQKKAGKAASGAVVEQARAIAAEADDDVIVAALDDADGNTLRTAMDVIRKTKPDAAMLLGSVAGSKIAFIAAVPEPLIGRGLKAGDWVREVAKVAGGGGGGRPDMAQAGGKDPAKLGEALAKAREHAASILG